LLKELITAPASLSRSAILVVWTFASVYLVPFEADFVLALVLYYLWYTERETLHAPGGAVSDPLFWLAAALAVLLGLSGLWSTGASPADHGQIWARAIAIIGFMLVFAHAFSQQQGFGTYLRHIVILAALISALICIALYIIDPPYPLERLEGLFRLNNPGRAGHQYAATLPFLAVTFVLGQGRWKVLAAAAIAATLAVVFLSGTRAAWIGSTLGMLSFALATNTMTRSRLLALIALGAVVIGGIFLYAASYPGSTLHELLLPRGDSYRMELWRVHLERLLDSAWLFGNGALTEQPFILILDNELRGAHNLYLSTAEQVGVVGLALFIALIGWTGWRLLGQLEHAVARMGFSLLVTGCVLSMFNGDRLIDKVSLVWFVFWLPFAIAVSLRSGAQDGRQAPGSSA
jgi:O-antigen ligase